MTTCTHRTSRTHKPDRLASIQQGLARGSYNLNASGAGAKGLREPSSSGALACLSPWSGERGLEVCDGLADRGLRPIDITQRVEHHEVVDHAFIGAAERLAADGMNNVLRSYT